MPTERYLKSLLKKVEQQIRALEGGLRHIGSEQTKLEKKKLQFTHMLDVRTAELQKIKKQIENIQKVQLEEGGIDRWSSLFP